MKRLFIAKDKSRLYQSYTPEQIGESLILSEEEFRKNPQQCKEIHYIFSTWGMIPFTEDEISDYFPHLEAVFYAAGSVKYFAPPFFKRNIRIFSAWMANAVPVAEFLVAQILLANKGYFLMPTRYKEEGFQTSRSYCRSFTGNYKAKVGFLGYGSITEYTINLLKPYSLDIYIASNHLTEEEATKLNIKKADMDYIFSNCQTISNNMANIPNTENIITESHFRSMGEYATFINTGRGTQVDLEALKQVFREKTNCVALLDVTDPAEPLPPDDEIWNIPNIFITPHSAGSTAHEIYRMGDYMLQTYEALVSNQAVSYEVTEKMLDTMA